MNSTRQNKLVIFLLIICAVRNTQSMDCKVGLQRPELLQTELGLRVAQEEQVDVSCINETPAEIQSYIIQISVGEDRDIVFLIYDILKLRNVSKQWASLVKSKSFLKNIFAFFWRSLLNVNAKESEINIQLKQSKALINMVFDKVKLANYKGKNEADFELWNRFLIPTLSPFIYKIEQSRKWSPILMRHEALQKKIEQIEDETEDMAGDVSMLEHNISLYYSDIELKKVLEDLVKEVEGFWHPAFLIALIYLHQKDYENLDQSVVLLNYINSIQLLINSGINLNVRTGRNLETPLMIAIVKGNIQLIKMLIEAGADPKIKNRFGEDANSKAIKLSCIGSTNEANEILRAIPSFGCYLPWIKF